MTNTTDIYNSNNRVTTNKAIIVVRLQVDQYRALEKEFNKFRPNSESSVLEAGFALGVQAVLTSLRLGYTVDEV
jgi:hypothetical protein